MKKIMNLVGILGVLVLGGANLAFCGTVTVSGTTTVFTTIQAGVNACPTGGTVSVSAGTYNEAIYINKKIALIGVGTPTITADRLDEAKNVITLDGILFIEGGIISGFRITGAKDNGISCFHCPSLTITKNTIIKNGQNGIVFFDSQKGVITNNTILGNGRNGILCLDDSSPTITKNTITGNKRDGVYCIDSFPTITKNTITGNGEKKIDRGFTLYKPGLKFRIFSWWENIQN